VFEGPEKNELGGNKRSSGPHQYRILSPDIWKYFMKISCIIFQMKLDTQSTSHGCEILLEWISQNCLFLQTEDGSKIMELSFDRSNKSKFETFRPAEFCLHISN